MVFVRHTAPGERVRARITDTTSRFWRADAVEILEPSADRVPSRWPEAGPGGVGGGELAHLSLPGQRSWKAEVITDTLRRIGHLDPEHAAIGELQVAAVPGDDEADGLHTRSRISLVADAQGRAGMYAHRSHEVRALGALPLAEERIVGADLLARRWPAGARIDAIAPSDGELLLLVDGEPLRGGRRKVRERLTLPDGRTYTYRVAGTGFWQVHTGAPAMLAEAVLAAAQVGPGTHVADLYSGSGLFSAPLAGETGPGGRVDAVEGDEQAVRDARRNAHGMDQIHLHTGDVATVLTQTRLEPSVVVLDPPRSGAGRQVLDAVLRPGPGRGPGAGDTGTGPDRVVYVACDPAALARDLAHAGSLGYELLALQAFDIFPHTHHVECVAVLSQAPG